MGRQTPKTHSQNLSVLLDLFRERRSLTFTDIGNGMKASGIGFNRSLLKEMLTLLLREGKLRQNGKRYSLPGAESLGLVGTFSQARGGFGFVQPEDGSEEVFIPASRVNGAQPGDLVEIYLRQGKRGREGEILRVVRRKNPTIFGYFQMEGQRTFLIPLDVRLPETVELLSLRGAAVAPGEIVEASLRDGLRGETVAERIVRVFGSPEKEGVDLEVTLARYNLSREFPPSLANDMEGLREKMALEVPKRRDLRRETICTIDGADAKDFDDAVSLRREGEFYRLGVHIADVSFFVPPETLLDKEAERRGNSVYLPGTVVPMLPFLLSDDLCSLVPQEDRLTMTVEMVIDGQGRVREYELFPSVLRSAARLTYERVQEFFDGQGGEIPEALHVPLEGMKELTEILQKKRRSDGSLDFDLPEPTLLYKEGTLVGVTSAERLFAHRLIEEFMLLANETVALHLEKRGIPILSRVHEPPEASRLVSLRQTLSWFNYHLDPLKGKIALQLQRIIDQALGKPEERFINLTLLKSLKVAHYTALSRGHFGLQKEHYCHFTSPIRRYPDLVIHRLVKLSLQGKRVQIDQEALERVGKSCSQTERSADEAEKELLRWRTYRLLKGRLGEETVGRVTVLTQNAIILELEDYFVEGFLPYSELPGDYFYPDEERVNLQARRKSFHLRLGETVKVQIASVDPQRQRIYLVPSEAEERFFPVKGRNGEKELSGSAQEKETKSPAPRARKRKR